MNGYLYVAADAFQKDEDLAAWLEHALAFVEALPAKQSGAGRTSRRRR
jgi:hypothetical protein